MTTSDIDLFRAKGLKFRISKFLTHKEIPPEELSELRRKYGM